LTQKIDLSLKPIFIKDFGLISEPKRSSKENAHNLPQVVRAKKTKGRADHQKSALFVTRLKYFCSAFGLAQIFE
jgi:hypothetical protein